MKKITKILGAVAVISSAIAGGVLIYRKFFAADEEFKDFEDEFEDDFESDFEESDLDVPAREYVSFTPAAEAAKEAEAEIAPEISGEDKEGTTTEDTEETTTEDTEGAATEDTEGAATESAEEIISEL